MTVWSATFRTAARGARLAFNDIAAIPAEFELVIPQRGDSRRVRIVWRHERKAGVVFLDQERDNVVPLDAARRIKALEAERNHLRQRIAALSETSI
jgi:hypothetical protein